MIKTNKQTKQNKLKCSFQKIAQLQIEIATVARSEVYHQFFTGMEMVSMFL